MNQEMLKIGEKRSSIRELFEYGNNRKKEIGEDNVFDFSLGNPSVPAPEIVNKSLSLLLYDNPHGYTSAAGDYSVRTAVSEYINKTFNANSSPDLIYLTCGAAASLTITLNAILNVGDEVVVFAPYFPEYKVFIEKAGGKLVPCKMTDDFQISENKLKSVINEKTRAVVVNSPNNPTGVILNEESLKILSKVLSEKQKEFGNEIYLLSDEPYRELTYGKKVPFIPTFYDNTVVCYSFSKSLSLPGERIGYIHVSEKVKFSDKLFAAIMGAGRALGYVCAPSLFQFMLKDVLGKTSDINIYRENRDLIYNSLNKMGFDSVLPEGAFYLFIKVPDKDSVGFCEKAKKHEILLVPSDDFGIKGYARLSYCVSKEKIEKSLPAFKKLAEELNLAER